ncbi:MAG: acyltransferase family protein [Bifidobacteriaceae bacterium]|nr:acyltransferase family protein [Bifidobacteriaceae bacterium]MCI1979438.1 acyltransferase family protein [Bifidobacteriaceae bacterium]
MDIAKTIGILLVIFVHFVFHTSEYPNTWYSHFAVAAYQYGVPLFFMANGALLLTRKLDLKKHYRRLLTIVIVTLVWKAIDLVVFAYTTEPIGVRNSILFMLGGSEFDGRPSGFVWFMNAFIGLHLIVPMLKTMFDAADGRRTLYITMGVIAFFSILGDTARTLLTIVGSWFHVGLVGALQYVDEYNMFGKYAYAILYFILGGLVLEKFQKARSESGKIVWPFRRVSLGASVAVLVVCQVLLFLTLWGERAASGYEYRFAYSYTQLAGVIGTVIVFCLCLMASPSQRASKFYKEVGSQTFGMYMTHIFLLMTINYLELRFFADDNFAALGGVGSLLVNFALILLAFFVALAISMVGSRIPVLKKLFFH